MSSQQEYYIRTPADTEARGPFNMGQLSSLVESDQIDAETLFYDVQDEQWKAIGANDALKNALWPEKTKLKVKPKEKIQSLNIEKEDDAPITVQEMLNAAEGRTEDTRGKGDPAKVRVKVAGFAAWTGCLAFLFSAVALLFSNLEITQTLDPTKIASNPLTLLGAIDLVFFLLLALHVVAIYPIVRFRAALGLGFLGFFFYAQGNTAAALAAIAGSTGLYLLTISLSYALFLPAALAALGGMAGLIYVLIVQ